MSDMRVSGLRVTNRESTAQILMYPGSLMMTDSLPKVLGFGHDSEVWNPT